MRPTGRRVGENSIHRPRRRPSERANVRDRRRRRRRRLGTWAALVLYSLDRLRDRPPPARSTVHTPFSVLPRNTLHRVAFCPSTPLHQAHVFFNCNGNSNNNIAGIVVNIVVTGIVADNIIANYIVVVIVHSNCTRL